MQFEDHKIFRYRYDFESKYLSDFIRERYIQQAAEADISRMIEERVRINGKKVHSQTLLHPGDWLEYEHRRSDETSIKAEVDVLYEDDWILALSKPDYLPVTPSTHYYFNSMAIMAKERFGNPGLSPVHRLDIETSGVLLFGKDKRIRSAVQRMFQDHQVEKRYQAILFNKPSVDSVSGDLALDRSSRIYTKQVLTPAHQQASTLTIIEKLESWGKYTRAWLRPVTGKTNQIRAHMAAIGCPIVGDKKYYPDETVFLDWFRFRDTGRLISQIKLPRQALHCESLSLISPFSQQAVTITDRSQAWINKIRSLL